MPLDCFLESHQLERTIFLEVCDWLPDAIAEVDQDLQDLASENSFGGMDLTVPMKLSVWKEDWFAPDNLAALRTVAKAFNSFLGPLNRITDMLERDQQVCTLSHCFSFTLLDVLEGYSEEREELLDFVFVPFKRLVGDVTGPVANAIEQALKDPVPVLPIDASAEIQALYDASTLEDIKERLGLFLLFYSFRRVSSDFSDFAWDVLPQPQCVFLRCSPVLVPCSFRVSHRGGGVPFKPTCLAEPSLCLLDPHGLSPFPEDSFLDFRRF